MTKIFRPMLACNAPQVLTAPERFFASPKLDGVRCVLHPELGAITRSGKRVANKATAEVLETLAPLALDGELILGDPTDKDVFRKTSAFLRNENAPLSSDLRFYAFDSIANPTLYAGTRIAQYHKKCYLHEKISLRPLPQIRLKSQAHLEEVIAAHIEAGFEGTMLRLASGQYKNGRSTEREAGLMKIKPTEHAEARIDAFEPLFRNENVAQTNELGYAKRSSHAEGLVAEDTLGALVCSSSEARFPVQFNIGSGFTEAERKEIWRNRQSLKGAIVRFKYQAIGSVLAPRCPIFLGMRPIEDAESA